MSESPIELSVASERYPDYPKPIIAVPADLRHPPPEALASFRHWTNVFMEDLRGDDAWIPLGRIGPVVILGHPDPRQARVPSYPLWGFSLIEIPRHTYRHLKLIVEEKLTTGTSTPFARAEHLQQLPHRGDTFFHSKRKLLEIFLSFPGTSEQDLSMVRHSLEQTNEEEMVRTLPLGWREALPSYFPMTPLIDTTTFLPTAEVNSLIPEKFGREHGLVPVTTHPETNELVVAARGPKTPAFVHAINSAWKVARNDKAAHLKLRLVSCQAGAREDMERRLAAKAKSQVLAPSRVTAPGISIRDAGVTARTNIRLGKKEYENLRFDMPDIEPEKILNLAMYKAIEASASDLHIDLSHGMGRLRVRRDGHMQFMGSFGLDRLSAIMQLLRVAIGSASGGDQSIVDGKFAIRYQDSSFYDVRVNILPGPDSVATGYGYATLRFLAKESGTWTLNKLHLGKEDLKDLLDTLDKPHGIVLITGPTGSGKTTTLNAMIQHLNSGESSQDEGTLKILTLEDPVEYTIDGVQQVQTSIKLQFPEGIRGFLRADPDVILVGEIRDQETAAAAINASRTGHLVFSTLHTNGAAETIGRLRGMGVPAYDLDGTLLTVMAQRLIPRLCVNCKEGHVPQPEEVALFEKYNLPVPENIYEPSLMGCNNCERGWRGRFPVLEIVKIVPEIRRAIARNAGEGELQDLFQKLGFKNLIQQGLLKVSAGETSIRQAKAIHGGWD